MLKVKVCGITNLEDARLAESLGADALGFVFYPKSPRAVTPRLASTIVKKLSPFTLAVGVFVDAPEKTILLTVRGVGLDMVQLHGSETPQTCRRLARQVPVIKTFRIGGGEFPNVYVYNVDYFLFDTYDSARTGGTGRSFDWKRIAHLKGKADLILSGGLREDNIAQAVAAVEPAVVDFSSSVEAKPGKKDPEKLRAIFKVINGLR